MILSDKELARILAAKGTLTADPDVWALVSHYSDLTANLPELYSQIDAAAVRVAAVEKERDAARARCRALDDLLAAAQHWREVHASTLTAFRAEDGTLEDYITRIRESQDVLVSAVDGFTATPQSQ